MLALIKKAYKVSAPGFGDLTKGWLPVTALVVVVGSAISGTALVVGFQRDTQRDIAALRIDLTNRMDAMQAEQRQTITLTEFENWRLRLQWANRASPSYEVPEFKK